MSFPFQQFENQMTSNFGMAIGITFFDVSFFILITTIGLNIIFGIIVDTFSQLRDSKVRNAIFYPPPTSTKFQPLLAHLS